MNIKRKILTRAMGLSEKDMNHFYQALEQLRKNIARIKESNKGLTANQCVNSLYRNFIEVLSESQNLDNVDFYRFFALEKVLKPKKTDEILLKAIHEKIYCDDSENSFNGNQENDVKSILREYFDIYYKYRLVRLQEESSKDPKNLKLKNEIMDVYAEMQRVKNGDLSIYDENKFIREQKDFLTKLHKRYKGILTNGLVEGLVVKLQLLHDMGRFDEYTKQYNKLLDRISLSSIFRVSEPEEIFKKLINKQNLDRLPVSDLLALNAFWTNRLTKEVERLNEAVYVLTKTDQMDMFFNGKEELGTLAIRSGLAEYRTITSCLTDYKLKKKDNMQDVVTLNDERFAQVDVKLEEIFSEEEIKEYGKKKLDFILNSVLTLNNFSQLLYDQKDMMLENTVTYFLTSDNYFNAGYVEEENNRKSSKSLIGVDLKGFNAPILLHYHKEKLKKLVKSVTGGTVMPLYRGIKDFRTDSSQNENDWISTNLLFPISKEQKLKLAQRSEILGTADTNNRFVKHILWMYQPKKELPRDIWEESREIDLESGKINILSSSRKQEK